MNKKKQPNTDNFFEPAFEKDYSISLTDAARFTKKWRESKNLEDPISFNVPVEGPLQLLDRVKRNNIEAQDITFYLAINDAGKRTMVYVATDKNKNDILEYPLTIETGGLNPPHGPVYNQVGDCPKTCSKVNVLNK